MDDGLPAEIASPNTCELITSADSPDGLLSGAVQCAA